MYKLIIKKNLEEKIRYLCNTLPEEEWSGILFYNVTGDFEKIDLEISCVDMIVLNIGSQTYTEFTINPEVAGYMVENNLTECSQGLIHSHNIMETFFSDTDIKTLKEEGEEKNHFLSLIVNNAGTYSARITQNVYTEGTFVGNTYYNTFNNKTITKNITQPTKSHKLNIIELDVVKEESEKLSQLKVTIKKLQQEKQEKKELNYKLLYSNDIIPANFENRATFVPIFNKSEDLENDNALGDIEDIKGEKKNAYILFCAEEFQLLVTTQDAALINRVIHSLMTASLSPISTTSTFNKDKTINKWLKKIDELTEEIFSTKSYEEDLENFIYNFVEVIFNSILFTKLDEEHYNKYYKECIDEYEVFVEYVISYMVKIIEEYEVNTASTYLSKVKEELLNKL